jgi:hypothetical protein
LQGEYGGPGQELLTVVENQQPMLGLEDSRKPLRQIAIRSLLYAYCPGHRCPQQGGIWDTAQVNEVDSVGEPWRSCCRFLDGQAGLADTSGTDQGHQPVIRD